MPAHVVEPEVVASFTPSHGKARKELVAAAVGGIVEGYDWTVYAVMAPYFAAQLFPGDDPVAQLLAAYIGFAVGFLARPLGSVLIGGLADRRGRMSALVVSMASIAVANLVIAATPTAAVFGLGAAITVVLARLVMGVSFGGEIPTGAAYITETAPAHRRFRYSSIASLGGVIGPLLAFITLAVLLAAFGDRGLSDGGWRIAFVVAGLGGLVAVWIRRSVRESREFEARREADRRAALRPALLPLLRSHRRLMAAVFFGCAGGTIAFYLGTVYLPVHADAHSVIVRAEAERLMPLALLTMLVAMLLGGWLADRFGAFRVFRAGYALLAVGTVPLFLALAEGVLPFLAVAIIYLAVFGLVLAQANVIFSQLFPTSIRTVGYGVPYTLSAAVFGGTTPLLAQGLLAAGRPGWLMWYAAGAAMVSLAATTLVRPGDVRVRKS